MKLVALGLAISTPLLALLIAFVIPGCSLHRPERQSMASAALRSSSEPEWTIKRVGGDMDAQVSQTGNGFMYESARITTALPAGYPAPTPPGAIDLKQYPLVRRAQISGTMGPDWGMNFAFFPLFNHIKRREIAMTSPVEMNYDGMDIAEPNKPDSWTMSFLYRSPDLAATGVDEADERVLIEDIAPVTVISIGMQGDYKMDRVQSGLEELSEWLDGQSEWESLGEPRALFYNGPEARSRDKWLEVQIPVRRR